jgi:hypothetical protein
MSDTIELLKEHWWLFAIALVITVILLVLK